MSYCKNRSRQFAAIFLLASATNYAGNVAAEPNISREITSSTPPGITLVPVERIGNSVAVQSLGTRLGDSDGWSLYIFDADKNGISHCTGSCEKEFPPVIALPGSKPIPDWTLFEREDGRMQWVYKGKPLYRFARETRFNEVIDNLTTAEAREKGRIRSFEQRAEKDIKRTLEEKKDKLYLPWQSLKETDLLPPASWQIAWFIPEVPNKVTPVDISLREVSSINSVAFVDNNGMTLYAYSGDIEDTTINCAFGCTHQWLPLIASALARPVGEFSPVQRSSGDRQWSINGVPLFTYKGDTKPGDAKGSDILRDFRRLSENNTDKADNEWYIPVHSRHFMPDNTLVREEPAQGSILATADGKPLYSRYRSEYLNGHKAYIKGKLAGTAGCDSKCLETWHPFLAPDNAQPHGFWEIVKREDGSRQWAYKGFVQYTNVNDHNQGRAIGDSDYDYVVGDDGRYSVKEFMANRLSPEWAQAIAWFWRLSSP